jgi:UDP-N-acetylmuramoyl-L-alanyl-D-glutamate--2,6-diaminopimelate ligase
MFDVAITQIAQEVHGTPLHTRDGMNVSGHLSASSARVSGNGIFVAIRGNSADGHSFVDEAFSRGAGVAVVEDAQALKGRPGIVVKNSRLALSRLASYLNGEPSKKMRVIGITGTNGKTTTNWILYHALNKIGAGALRIGTLGTEYLGKATLEGTLTSPDPVSLHGIMGEAVAAGARSCVMETSSHALDQARVEDVAFDIGVFTNLTRDHLDYHKTFDHYFAAKCHLFELLSNGPKGTKGAVINIDDPYGVRLWERCREVGLRDLSFGRDARAAFQIARVEETPHAMKIAIRMPGGDRVRSVFAPFIGPHNAENVVAAFAALIGLGHDEDAVAEALRVSPQVSGRLERVGEGRPRVFVDYAHTPDALERVLRAVQVSTVGSLWCVFGCGGDRDRGKRPEMGRIASACADRVVVTSDNPRTEDPQAIIADILTSGISPALIDVDRAAAIARVVREARDDDTIVIAGKGHENYQILGTTRIHFSDQEEAQKALAGRDATPSPGNP